MTIADLTFCELTGCRRGNLAAAVEQTMCRHEHLTETALCPSCLVSAMDCPPQRCGYCAVTGVSEPSVMRRFVPVPDDYKTDGLRVCRA